MKKKYLLSIAKLQKNGTYKAIPQLSFIFDRKKDAKEAAEEICLHDELLTYAIGTIEEEAL